MPMCRDDKNMSKTKRPKCNPDKIETEGPRKGKPVYLGDSPVGKDCESWKDGECLCEGLCCLKEYQ